jgi:UDP-N-acetylmuramoyl-L-alanyl-D-glutamate--2,6-diaminopimelate ligase
MLKALVRKLVPEPVISVYHLALAHLAAAYYGHPSEELIVIGVTGTNGKSSTTTFIGRLLEHCGEQVGWTTTVGFKVGAREWVNDQKMTMLGRFQTQKMLRQMADAGCRYAIIETSSQGISQFRHAAINYDVVVFTNLTPEHIEAHGGFDNYKQAKGKLFEHGADGREKTFDGVPVPKAAVVNIDDEHAPYFLSFALDRQYGFGFEGKTRAQDIGASRFFPVIGKALSLGGAGTSWRIDQLEFHLRPIGLFNAYNALAAVTVCHALGIRWSLLADAVSHLLPVPGRLEAIEEGQPFSVLVDYAYEPAALQAVYDTLALLPKKRLIHVTGSAGGGRDVWRRSEIGRLAAERDDIVIVTNEDPYDDPPLQIIHQVADAAKAAGKVDGETLLRIVNRAEAIAKAISLAEPGDLVLITGKGCEPVMAVADGKKVPWDDRMAARNALHPLVANL